LETTESGGGELLDAQPDPATSDGQARREEAIDLETAITRLPTDLRTVLVMSTLGEMNSTEIGEALGCPPATVRYRLAAARRQLIRLMRLTPACTVSERQDER
ncbi:MAG: RNA polymerase sigma factor, partial [Anaerolineae bacterium]